MSGKGEKCCCCAGNCINIGSIFNQCTVCVESPIEWYISDWGGAISHTDSQGQPPLDPIVIFGCCLQVDTAPGAGSVATGMVSRLLTGNRLGSTCTWRSTINFCEDGDGNPLPNNYWVLTINGLDPGSVTLQLLWDDYKVATWVNRFPWNCLCRNEMVRRAYMDVGDTEEIEACGVPTMICLSPIPPCCPERQNPLPRTIYADLIAVAYACPELAGVTVPLVWDPADGDGKWVAEIDDCDVILRFWCTRILGSTTTSFHYDAWPVGSVMDDTTRVVHLTDTVCDPLYATTASTFYAPCCSGPLPAVYPVFYEL